MCNFIAILFCLYQAENTQLKEEIEKLKAENVKLKKELESKDQEKKSKGKA